MYEKVETPRDITQEWLDRAFAPLENYLNQEHSKRKKHILSNMIFMGNVEEKFHYKNRYTRSYIVFNQIGELIFCAKDALSENWRIVN